jgi:hypothetical protein
MALLDIMHNQPDALKRFFIWAKGEIIWRWAINNDTE